MSVFESSFAMLLGTFWDIVLHHFEILEVSEVLDATTGKLSARSTSWEGSRSPWRPKNDEKEKKYFWNVFSVAFSVFGTLFLHHFEILEVSEALDATTGKLSARSTSWEGSLSPWS